MLFPTLFFILLGCLVSWLAIYLFLESGLGCGGPRQEPQHHHTHSGVVPRIGGVGLICGLAATYLLAFFYLDAEDNRTLIHYAVFMGAVAAFCLGFIDDIRPLGARVKLLAQILIAVFAHECGLEIDKIRVPFFGEWVLDLGLLSMVVTVFWFVALMNLINLIDGLDGLAGGIGLMLMVLLAFLGFEGGIAFSTILALGMVGALLGFLFHNFPPAKVYMGDSGAYMIGYTIAALALLNSQKGSVLAALIAPVLALALPIADVAFAILRRGIKGLPLFRPDRHHIHHRLLRSGLSHRRTVLLLYGISLVALVGALLFFAEQGRYVPIFLGFAFVVVLVALRGRKITNRSLQAIFTESMQSRRDARNALFLKNWLSLEVERADSGKHLWADYHFVLKKMGFCRAELRIGEVARTFYVPNTPHNDPEQLRREVHEIRGEAPAELTLYAEKAHFSDRQFELICDIAAEAWSQAAARWKTLNATPLTFDAVARDPSTYKEHKARALYRPTY